MPNITIPRIMKSRSLLNMPTIRLNINHITPIRIIVFSFVASFMFNCCIPCHYTKYTYSNHDHYKTCILQNPYRYMKSTYYTHDHCKKNTLTNQKTQNKHDQRPDSYNTLNPDHYPDKRSMVFAQFHHIYNTLFDQFPDMKNIHGVLTDLYNLVKYFLVHSTHQAVLYMAMFCMI